MTVRPSRAGVRHLPRAALLLALGLAGCAGTAEPTREDVQRIAQAYADALRERDPDAASLLAAPSLAADPSLGPLQARYRSEVSDLAQDLVGGFRSVDRVEVAAAPAGGEVEIEVRIEGETEDGARSTVRARATWLLGPRPEGGWWIVGHGPFVGEVLP